MEQNRFIHLKIFLQEAFGDMHHFTFCTHKFCHTKFDVKN